MFDQLCILLENPEFDRLTHDDEDASLRQRPPQHPGVGRLARLPESFLAILKKSWRRQTQSRAGGQSLKTAAKLLLLAKATSLAHKSSRGFKSCWVLDCCCLYLTLSFYSVVRPKKQASQGVALVQIF